MGHKLILAEPTRLAKIVENWRSNVRGVDVAIDQVHNPDLGAAGWVRDLKVAPSTTNPGKEALFARVEWTPLGKELVGGGIFRYMSAEFGQHTDPETGDEHPDVLFASTLTNRPFVKGMAPVTLDAEWVEILREGDYIHDLYGPLSIQADEAPGRWLRRLYEGLKTVFAKIEPADAAGDTENKDCRHEMHRGALQTEEPNMEKLIAFLKELGVELAEGADPVDALREFWAKQTETVATLGATQTAMAEAKAETSRLAKTVTELKVQLAERARAAFMEDMIRAGKLLPAERPHFEELYTSNEAAVRKLLGERAPKVDLTERGTASDKTPPVEDRQLAKMDELIRGGMTPVEAYKAAHREVQ